MSERAMEYARLASTAVGLLMCLAAWRWKNLGRSLYVALFLWAGLVNLRTALTDPAAYLDFAHLTPIDGYRTLILGSFARHIPAFVVPLALGQFAIAVLIALRGRSVRLGLLGAMVFLLAVAPLGIGSGFPATVLMAAGAGLLVRFTFVRSLPAELLVWLHRGRRKANRGSPPGRA